MTRYRLAYGSSVKLTAPGPDGRGFISCTLVASGPKLFKTVRVADSIAEKFSTSIEENVANGTLIKLTDAAAE